MNRPDHDRLDGTPNKSRLAPTTFFGVSLSVAKSRRGKSVDMPLYRYVGGTIALSLRGAE